MKFKECSIAGKKFNVDTFDSINAENELDPDAILSASGNSPRGPPTSNSYHNLDLDEEARLFFISLAVCHTVIPEEASDGSLNYNASSPDEKALVEGAAMFGFKFSGRKPDSALVTIKDEAVEEFEVLDTIEFTSARKRMSTIVRFPDGKLKLLIKGADMMINDRLGNDKSTHKKHLDVTFGHLDDFARKGLRTLCLATKDISEEEYRVWKNEFIDASNAIDGRFQSYFTIKSSIEFDKSKAVYRIILSLITFWLNEKLM